MPPTLEKRLEALAALRTLQAQDEELMRERREAIAALRHDSAQLQRDFAVFFRHFEIECAELRRLLKYNPDQPRVPKSLPPANSQSDPNASSAYQKAAVDDPEHPGWPAGTPDSKGGQFRPKDGTPGAGTKPPLRYAAIGDFPPPPPGYDPKTWKQGQWPNGRHWLEDPNRNKYTAHPEDDGHWRHWDKQDSDGNDQGQWPSNYKKPWPTQKRQSAPDQSLTDPNGDAPPWHPFTFAPTFPVDPLPVPEMPVIPRIFIPAW